MDVDRQNVDLYVVCCYAVTDWHPLITQCRLKHLPFNALIPTQTPFSHKLRQGLPFGEEPVFKYFWFVSNFFFMKWGQKWGKRQRNQTPMCTRPCKTPNDLKDLFIDSPRQCAVWVLSHLMCLKLLCYTITILQKIIGRLKSRCI